jgi:vesicle transport protein SEC22
MDDEEKDLQEYKNQAKQLFKKLSLSPQEPKCSLESPPYSFHYITEFGVCYLCICDKSYPKKLAFQYLEELQREFHASYGQEMQRVARPYAFVKFGNLKSLIKIVLFRNVKSNTKMLVPNVISRG